MIWVMLLQIAVTNQIVGIDVASEEECRAAMDKLAAGEQMTVTLPNGVVLPVAKGIDCVMRRPKAPGV